MLLEWKQRCLGNCREESATRSHQGATTRSVTASSFFRQVKPVNKEQNEHSNPSRQPDEKDNRDLAMFSYNGSIILTSWETASLS